MENWRKGSSKGEQSQSGAFFRMSYRKSPDLARRVLAEVHSMVKEGRIKFNPGSAFVDLWSRWGGGKVSGEKLPANQRARAAR